METDGENDRAQRPVGKHTDPDSNRAESPYPAEINAQAYPAQPHGAAEVIMENFTSPAARMP